MASSETLAGMAQSLQQAVSLFKVEEDTFKAINGSGPASNPKDVEYPMRPEGSASTNEEPEMSR